MLPTPPWAWDKYITHKAFCLLVACPSLTLISRTHPTDTADRTGQVLPTATHCASSYLSHLFQGPGQPTWTEIAFPHILHTAGQQPFQKTELNLTVNTHVLEHFPYSHTRMQNYLLRPQTQNTHVSVPCKPEKPWNAVVLRAPSSARLPLPGIMALTDWSWIPVAQG